MSRPLAFLDPSGFKATMAEYDFTAQRLFVEGPLTPGARIACDRDRTNYLVNVLRLADGAAIHVFDGASGEWRAVLVREGKKAVALEVVEKVREQTAPGDIWLAFAPLKHARLDYMVQKAVEMGAARLVPVITRRTQVSRVNTERMRANIIEAAEQCGVLAVPTCDEPITLEALLAQLGTERALIFCDEDAPVSDPFAALSGPLKRGAAACVLIGPEGGFTPEEQAAARAVTPHVILSLGPRILRADTAAVAALALVQAVIGDTS